MPTVELDGTPRPLLANAGHAYLANLVWRELGCALRVMLASTLGLENQSADSALQGSTLVLGLATAVCATLVHSLGWRVGCVPIVWLEATRASGRLSVLHAWQASTLPRMERRTAQVVLQEAFQGLKHPHVVCAEQGVTPTLGLQPALPVPMVNFLGWVHPSVGDVLLGVTLQVMRPVARSVPLVGTRQTAAVQSVSPANLGIFLGTVPQFVAYVQQENSHPLTLLVCA